MVIVTRHSANFKRFILLLFTIRILKIFFTCKFSAIYE